MCCENYFPFERVLWLYSILGANERSGAHTVILFCLFAQIFQRNAIQKVRRTSPEYRCDQHDKSYKINDVRRKRTRAQDRFYTFRNFRSSTFEHILCASLFTWCAQQPAKSSTRTPIIPNMVANQRETQSNDEKLNELHWHSNLASLGLCLTFAFQKCLCHPASHDVCVCVWLGFCVDKKTKATRQPNI